MTPLQRKKFTNQIQRILHVPGNYRGGVLEFVIVVDYCLSQEVINVAVKEMITVLKNTDKIFLNARLNIIKWISDEKIIKEVSSMGMAQMGRSFEVWENGDLKKSYDELTRQLKLFYARSKIVIVLSKGDYITKEKEAVEKNLKPFLGRKMYLISPNDILDMNHEK